MEICETVPTLCTLLHEDFQKRKANSPQNYQYALQGYYCSEGVFKFY
jgi:hypothetical protein